MPDLLIALVVVSVLSLAIKSTQWIGVLGVFVLFVLYPLPATAVLLIGGVSYLFIRSKS